MDNSTSSASVDTSVIDISSSASAWYKLLGIPHGIAPTCCNCDHHLRRSRTTPNNTSLLQIGSSLLYDDVRRAVSAFQRLHRYHHFVADEENTHDIHDIHDAHEVRLPTSRADFDFCNAPQQHSGLPSEDNATTRFSVRHLQERVTNSITEICVQHQIEYSQAMLHISLMWSYLVPCPLTNQESFTRLLEQLLIITCPQFFSFSLSAVSTESGSLSMSSNPQDPQPNNHPESEPCQDPCQRQKSLCLLFHQLFQFHFPSIVFALDRFYLTSYWNVEWFDSLCSTTQFQQPVSWLKFWYFILQLTYSKWAGKAAGFSLIGSSSIRQTRSLSSPSRVSCTAHLIPSSCHLIDAIPCDLGNKTDKEGSQLKEGSHRGGVPFSSAPQTSSNLCRVALDDVGTDKQFQRPLSASNGTCGTCRTCGTSGACGTFGTSGACGTCYPRANSSIYPEYMIVLLVMIQRMRRKLITRYQGFSQIKYHENPVEYGRLEKLFRNSVDLSLATQLQTVAGCSERNTWDWICEPESGSPPMVSGSPSGLSGIPSGLSGSPSGLSESPPMSSMASGDPCQLGGSPPMLNGGPTKLCGKSSMLSWGPSMLNESPSMASARPSKISRSSSMPSGSPTMLSAGPSRQCASPPILMSKRPFTGSTSSYSSMKKENCLLKSGTNTMADCPEQTREISCRNDFLWMSEMMQEYNDFARKTPKGWFELVEAVLLRWNFAQEKNEESTKGLPERSTERSTGELDDAMVGKLCQRYALTLTSRELLEMIRTESMSSELNTPFSSNGLDRSGEGSATWARRCIQLENPFIDENKNQFSAAANPQRREERFSLFSTKVNGEYSAVDASDEVHRQLNKQQFDKQQFDKQLQSDLSKVEVVKMSRLPGQKNRQERADSWSTVSLSTASLSTASSGNNLPRKMILVIPVGDDNPALHSSKAPDFLRRVIENNPRNHLLKAINAKIQSCFNVVTLFVTCQDTNECHQKDKLAPSVSLAQTTSFITPQQFIPTLESLFLPWNPTAVVVIVEERMLDMPSSSPAPTTSPPMTSRKSSRESLGHVIDGVIQSIPSPSNTQSASVCQSMHLAWLCLQHGIPYVATCLDFPTFVMSLLCEKEHQSPTPPSGLLKDQSKQPILPNLWRRSPREPSVRYKRIWRMRKNSENSDLGKRGAAPFRGHDENSEHKEKADLAKGSSTATPILERHALIRCAPLKYVRRVRRRPRKVASSDSHMINSMSDSTGIQHEPVLSKAADTFWQWMSSMLVPAVTYPALYKDSVGVPALYKDSVGVPALYKDSVGVPAPYKDSVGVPAPYKDSVGVPALYKDSVGGPAGIPSSTTWTCTTPYGANVDERRWFRPRWKRRIEASRLQQSTTEKNRVQPTNENNRIQPKMPMHLNGTAVRHGPSMISYAPLGLCPTSAPYPRKTSDTSTTENSG